MLGSVFHTNYSKFWSAIYWSSHRIGWALVTGYIIHQCATGRWKLLKDLCSLSHLIPFSRLVFIAYLVYPIFIHLHSGLVRDGLHVSMYNMMNIYITRLVLTFALALLIHLLVELPFCSIEGLLLSRWMESRRLRGNLPDLNPNMCASSSCQSESGGVDKINEASNENGNNSQPLLTVTTESLISKPTDASKLDDSKQ